MPKIIGNKEKFSRERLLAVLRHYGWTGAEFARRHGICKRAVNMAMAYGTYGVSGQAKRIVDVAAGYEERLNKNDGV